MTNSKPCLTPAQQRAVDWLPKDGSWREETDELSEDIHALADGSFVVDCLYRNGVWLWRLTPKGIALFHGANNDRD